jgi:hypothetical protein
MWGPAQKLAFYEAKAALRCATRLAHSIPDALSSPPQQHTVAAVDLAMSLENVLRLNLGSRATHQKSSQSTLQALKSPSLRVMECEVEVASLWCDLSAGRSRLLVPEEDRYLVFSSIHNVAHPGMWATQRLISSRFVWHGMNSDVAGWCRDCQHCQPAKVTKQPASPVQPIPILVRRFSNLHVDIVGPLPVSSARFTYLFTMIDRTTDGWRPLPLRR